MEITELNRGRYLGYEDGENAIFINENNYKEKFQNYLSDSDNSNWSEIAKAGHDYTMKRFSNDEAVKELVNLMPLYGVHGGQSLWIATAASNATI